jgi:PTH1 family peptidyl-tRNA hydrolase
MEFKAVLGLGNTGSKYKNTYHNIGQLMIDFLLENDTLPENAIIAKNEGFINGSGSSAIKILKKIGGQPEKLLVIHDDSDIALGKYKLSTDRNSAGHKGIEDIINKIGSKKFWRLRIGIRPKEEEGKALDFVLKKISKENKEVLEKVFKEASSALTQF